MTKKKTFSAEKNKKNLIEKCHTFIYTEISTKAFLSYRRRLQPSNQREYSDLDFSCRFGWFIFVMSRSRIPDSTTATKEQGEKSLLSYLFLYPQISQN
jgi:hypothetical protein